MNAARVATPEFTTRAPAERKPPSTRARPGDKSGCWPVDNFAAISRCACDGGCPRCGAEEWPAGRRTLRISGRGDAAEREANGTADEVLRGLKPRVTVNAAGRAADPESIAAPAPSLADELGGLKGRGQHLHPAVRAYFESRLGTNLRETRVHHDSKGARLARSLGARAFTFGSHIVFGAGEYGWSTRASHWLLAHELTHVVQHRRHWSRKEPSAHSVDQAMIQRAQIGRVHSATDGGPDYFLYELDTTRSTFSALAGYYGVAASAIARVNPTRRPTALRHGQEIRIPAFDPPAEGSRPVGPALSSIVQSTTTFPIPARWNATANANLLGRLRRGTAIGAISPGADIRESELQQPATGILKELKLRGLEGLPGHVYGYIDPANVRSTLREVPAFEVNLIARMIWGEQRSEGPTAMEAAAWIARNRYDQGWGSYTDIITPRQFHGLASPAAVTGLTGRDLTRWNQAQSIAQEVVDGTRADPTGGVVYFGNGASVARRMRACVTRTRGFRWATIPGTNFHYSNGDYTAGCAIP